MAPKVTRPSSLPTPPAKAPAPAPPAMDMAISESSARAFSENMAPPPTGSASVSYSNWRAVPMEPTSACHPEMAPQAMVTNSIGQMRLDGGQRLQDVAGRVFQLHHRHPGDEQLALEGHRLASRRSPKIAAHARQQRAERGQAMVRNVTQNPM